MWRGGHVSGSVVALLVVSMAVTSCSSPTMGDPRATDRQARPSGETTTSELTAAACDIPAGQPFVEPDPVELTELGEANGARVEAAVYPHPDYEGNPWSQWGQGIVSGDGHFFSAIGDHLGRDGNSYIYEYDPTKNTLTMVGDVLTYVDHVPGTWGYGKIHSQMVSGPCGEIYFSTYWGSFRDIEFEGHYSGDVLFRLDPYSGTLSPLGVPVDRHGQASLAAAPEYGLVYGESTDPVVRNEDIEEGPFFAYDVNSGEVVYRGPDQPHVGFRSILVDANGVAYYSIGGGRLQTYDPASGETATHPEPMPGDWLRAATRPAPDGSVYGVTIEDRFFALQPDGSIAALGESLGYTASMALSPDGSVFYYMPGAHGNSAEWGSPLIAVDTDSGEQTVVAELNQIVDETLGYNLGGSYDVALSPDGGTVYLGVNVGEAGSGEGFGEVALLVVELP